MNFAEYNVFGLLNAFVKFKINGSNQIIFSEDRHFSIPFTYNNVV